jgi:hypothetical protein
MGGILLSVGMNMGIYIYLSKLFEGGYDKLVPALIQACAENLKKLQF